MKCKYCDCEDFFEKTVGVHLGVYCTECHRWQTWKKQSDNPKTKEEYKREYYEKMGWNYKEG